LLVYKLLLPVHHEFLNHMYVFASYLLNLKLNLFFAKFKTCRQNVLMLILVNFGLFFVNWLLVVLYTIILSSIIDRVINVWLLGLEVNVGNNLVNLYLDVLKLWAHHVKVLL
jgi:hypothetical protein